MTLRWADVALGSLTALALIAGQAQGQGSNGTIMPDASWDCGMAGGIPRPESGRLAFEIEIPLDRAAHIGKTPYGDRRIAVGLEGSVKGEKLTATVMPGALDLSLIHI